MNIGDIEYRRKKNLDSIKSIYSAKQIASANYDDDDEEYTESRESRLEDMETDLLDDISDSLEHLYEIQDMESDFEEDEEIEESEENEGYPDDEDDEDGDWDDDPDSDDYIDDDDDDDGWDDDDDDINDDILSSEYPQKYFSEKVSGLKTLNLFDANMSLSKVIEQLADDRGRSPELVDATSYIQMAQSKMREYSNRLRQSEVI